MVFIEKQGAVCICIEQNRETYMGFIYQANNNSRDNYYHLERESGRCIINLARYQKIYSGVSKRRVSSIG